MPVRTAKRIAPVTGRAMRVTRLDNCGRVVLGPYSQAISDGLVTVGFTAIQDAGTAITSTKFTGRPCVNQPAEPTLTGYGVTATFCNVDFDMFEIITKQTLVFDANGNIVGLEQDTDIPLNGDGFALEVWTGTAGGDACDDEVAEGDYGYLLLPFLKGGVLGDFTVENNTVNFVISGSTTRNGNQWGNGPYAVELDADGDPIPLFQAVSKTAPLRFMRVTLAPPLDTVGGRPVLDRSLPAFTAIAGIEGGTDMTAVFTTTAAATGPVWWDFGDGEWDYVAAPGGTDHIYADAGTYEVLASQNGIDWESTSVTVPFAP